jgi:predicted Zn finger-like uncharacterized protein
MRLQCPNCDAEYEVDASAIPYDGRDVQCSNCGHGWYQTHPDFERDDAIEAALYDPPPPFATAPSAIPEPAPKAAKPAPAAPDFPKREIDPEALRILREEVAFEKAKRAAEKAGGAPDTAAPSADLSLEAELDKMVMVDLPPPSAALAQSDVRVPIAPLEPDFANPPYVAPDENLNRTVVARRVARLKGTLEDVAAQSTAPPLSRPAPMTGGGQSVPAEPARAGLGQRTGVYTAVLAAVAAAAVYIYSPQIAANWPQAEPALIGYVSLINDLRAQSEIAIGQVAEVVGALFDRALGFIAAQGWI